MFEILQPKSLASMAQKVSDRFALAERSVATGKREDNSKLVNQTQRFELWARNLGLYHLGHSSLDYRFRDAPSLFEYTVGLLRNLEGLLVQRESFAFCLYSLVQCANSTSVMDTLDHRHLSSVDTKNTTNPPIGPHEQFSDDSEEDGFESSDDESITDLILGSVTATIDKLYRLSFKIRNPAMRLGFSKSLKYHEVDPETNVDLIDQFRENDQRHLEQLFASYRSISPANFEKDFLVRRLAKANTRRRQQFGYWKKRRAQFETMSKTEIIDKMAPDFIPGESENSPNLNVPAVPIAPSRPSTATHLDVSKVNLNDNASMVSSSTVANMKDEGNGDWFFIPPPPKHLWDGEEFECPYCFTLCPRKMLHQTNWQTHVLRDLRPYICTYEDCRDADQQYDRLGDWINHETFTHQRKSDMTSSDNGKLSIQESRKCPFCLENAGPQHIATHLRRVACFSLPRSTGSDDESSQGSQISDRADIRSNNSRVSEIRSETSFGGPESVSEESLHQQQPEPKDKEVNRSLERLESESADSHHTPLGIDITDRSAATSSAAPSPSTSLQNIRTGNAQVDALVQYLRVELAPLCEAYIAQPPADAKAREDEHKRLSETILAQVILKADDIVDEDTRMAKRTLIKEAQSWLNRIDEDEIGLTSISGHIEDTDKSNDEVNARLEKLILEERTEREAKEAAQLAKIEREEAEKAAREQQLAHDRKIGEGANETAAEYAQVPPLQKKPIKFKDALGRKFTFPFHFCNTWQAMEELIKQAFLHIEVIGPHVAEGHYDLVGPSGEIILPQVWEEVIEPGWSITMHMWPIPDRDPPADTSPAAPEPKKSDGGNKKSRHKPLGFDKWFMDGYKPRRAAKSAKVEEKADAAPAPQ